MTQLILKSYIILINYYFYLVTVNDKLDIKIEEKKKKKKGQRTKVGKSKGEKYKIKPVLYFDFRKISNKMYGLFQRKGVKFKFSST